MPFADKVRSRLAQLGMSRTELAEAIKSSQPQVSTWLTKGPIPSTEYVIKIAKILGLSLDYLLDDLRSESELTGALAISETIPGKASFHTDMSALSALQASYREMETRLKVLELDHGYQIKMIEVMKNHAFQRKEIIDNLKAAMQQIESHIKLFTHSSPSPAPVASASPAPVAPSPATISSSTPTRRSAPVTPAPPARRPEPATDPDDDDIPF